MGGNLLLKDLNTVSAWNQKPHSYEVSMGNSVKVISWAGLMWSPCTVLPHGVFKLGLYKVFSHAMLTQYTSKVLNGTHMQKGQTVHSCSVLILDSHWVLPRAISVLSDCTLIQRCCFVMRPHRVCSDALLSVCSALMFNTDVLISLPLLELRPPNSIIYWCPQGETKQPTKDS